MTEVIKGWMRQHFAILKGNKKIIKCKHCEKLFDMFILCKKIDFLLLHLLGQHDITELDTHPEREYIQHNYRIIRSKTMAICKYCNKSVNFFTHGVNSLTLHIKMTHEKCHLKKVISLPVSTRPKIFEINIK